MHQIPCKRTNFSCFLAHLQGTNTPYTYEWPHYCLLNNFTKEMFNLHYVGKSYPHRLMSCLNQKNLTNKQNMYYDYLLHDIFRQFLWEWAKSWSGNYNKDNEQFILLIDVLDIKAENSPLSKAKRGDW
jgi:hypothetical protein